MACFGKPSKVPPWWPCRQEETLDKLKMKDWQSSSNAQTHKRPGPVNRIYDKEGINRCHAPTCDSDRPGYEVSEGFVKSCGGVRGSRQDMEQRQQRYKGNIKGSTHSMARKIMLGDNSGGLLRGETILFPQNCDHANALLLTKTVMSQWDKKESGETPSTASQHSGADRKVLASLYSERERARQASREKGTNRSSVGNALKYENNGYKTPLGGTDSKEIARQHANRAAQQEADRAKAALVKQQFAPPPAPLTSYSTGRDPPAVPLPSHMQTRESAKKSGDDVFSRLASQGTRNYRHRRQSPATRNNAAKKLSCTGHRSKRCDAADSSDKQRRKGDASSHRTATARPTTSANPFGVTAGAEFHNDARAGANVQRDFAQRQHARLQNRAVATRGNFTLR